MSITVTVTKPTPHQPATDQTREVIHLLVARIQSAVFNRHDPSAEGFGTALTAMLHLEQMQMAADCETCDGAGVINGAPCPNVVTHPGR
ncbi:hypothetical protein ACH4TC_18560 [Streptomyces spororaveus]|uniref:hypothetical protein n=1 Tax=Streptomyces spororaveus TaxID=284039 RepID=UPI0037B95E78